MVKWHRLAHCAITMTVGAASASTVAADDGVANKDMIVGKTIAVVNHDECLPQHYPDYFACPPPQACPPNPCETIVPGMALPTPVTIPPVEGDAAAMPTEAVTPSTAEGAAAEATPLSDSFTDPLTEPITEPAPLDFANLSMPTGGVGFGSASTVAGAPAPGYIDYAPVRTRFRMRYDDAVGANDPTRAEFLYPSPTPGLGPNANGPNLLGAGLGDVEFQELSFMFEYAMFDRLSVFIDLPIRWVGNVDFDGDGNPDTNSGLGDIRTGFKYALIDDCCSHLTTQFLVSTPTGNSRDALGTKNVSFDIGLLFDHRINDDIIFFGELRDWFTLNAPTVTANTGPIDLDANILRFGAGVGVDLLEFGDCRCQPQTITGIFEVVGWTVLDGFSTDINGTNVVTDAQGDTIINGKYGVRYSSGQHTAYVGYGHNWTDDRWYSDLVRLEYGYNF